MSRLNLALAAKIWRSALPKGCNKLVLQCLVHHLNDESGLAWPSVQRMALMCCMSTRTVQGHLRKLCAAGLIRPRLRTGCTTHYSVHVDHLVALVFPITTVVLDAADQPVDNSEISAEAVDNSAPPCETPAAFAENMQENDTEVAKTDIKPVEICTLTVEELSPNSERTQSADAAPALPVLDVVEGVHPKVLADFAAIRKSKRKGRVTDTLIAEMRQQAVLAGLTLEQALEVCTHPDRKWARFEATWVSASIRASITAPSAPVSPPPPPPPPLTEREIASRLAARDAALAALRAKDSPAPEAAPAKAAAPAAPAAPAMPSSASDISIAPDSPPWVVKAAEVVNSYRAGKNMNRFVLESACQTLKISPFGLRAAAARSH
jgi:hypothetical protein